MPVPMFPVNSSNLSYVGWENDILYITFHNGRKYKYLDVPEYRFKELRESSSIGKYYSSQIKGVYTSEEL